jgi:hypothetical protein
MEIPDSIPGLGIITLYSLIGGFTLKMEAVFSSETMVITYQTIQ